MYRPVLSRVVFLFLTLAGLVSLAPAARADIFVWQDAKSGVSLSFPDTWEIVNNADADDVVRIAAPGREDEAGCRIRARSDRRFVIYPPRYDDSVQKVAYGRDFWSHFLTEEYNDPTIEIFGEPAGLGRGYGSYALASYTVPGRDSDSSRRGISFVSLYRDTAYIAECSALKGAYEKWNPVFRSIIKSVDFRKAVHELPTGHYRNFLYETSFWDIFR